MTITSGSRLGPYEVVSPLGAGGMGEVWKARDTRLDRSVAIKVLPADFAQNAQVKLRFEREAKTISQLNHPHICTLYDVGDGYLVMELLDGESLADRLAKGPLPLDQVLRYGVQIAEALDKAHKAGVVHRDLKPGNIMLTKSGAKLLDFGLAKPAEGGVVSALTSLRTEHKQGLTEEGTIVGTFQYMAPEQIEGGEVDARTDIFALGVVLYEMATGRRAFAGKTKASLIASILTAEPAPISAVQPMMPASFDRVVRKCLEKDADERWQSAYDVATALRWVSDAPVADVKHRSVSWKFWSVAAVLLLAAVTFATLWYRATSVPKRRVQTSLLPPDGYDFFIALGGPSLSPDGTRIAYTARSKGDTKTRIFVLRLDDGSRIDIGMAQVAMPFWSPDSKNIGFFAPIERKLYRVDVSGGSPQFICDVGGRGAGGTWNRDGVVVFATGSHHGLFRVAATGGPAVEFTKIDAAHENSHRWPSFLPDGRHIIYSAQSFGTLEGGQLYVGSLGSPERKFIAATGYPASYTRGFLLFCRGRELVAQHFDLNKLELRDEPVALVDGISQYVQFASAAFGVSDHGELAYVLGSAERSQLEFRDRSGKVIQAILDPGDYMRPAIAHDGHRFAYEVIGQDGTSDIWVYDAARANATRLTFEPGSETNAVWSPDDRYIAYAATDPKTGVRTIFRRLSSGAGEAEQVDVPNGTVGLTDWTPNGLLYHDSADIFLYSIASQKTSTVIATPFTDCCGRLSPDGHWLTYASDKSGRMEVYVQPFPVATAVYKLSAVGGSQPRWSANGREIVYDALDHRAMSVAITVNGTNLEAALPKELFTYRFKGGGWGFDVSGDGQRFLVNNVVGDETLRPATIVLNWAADLKH